MMKVTSALANKMIKQLEEEKSYWISLEDESYSYTAAIGEDPIIPEYDYIKVSKNLETIEKKILTIKHALNISNATNSVETEEGLITIDVLLIRMAQLNTRKSKLDDLRKKLPKERLRTLASWGTVTKVPEYRYLNYDVEIVNNDYKRISQKIFNLQLALDKYNQTFKFEIDI